MRILIIDDEQNIRRTLRMTVSVMGHECDEADSIASALQRAQQQSPDVAFVDLRLGSESGLDLIEPLLASAPRLAIVMITAYATVDSAVEAMRRGAFDYLPKPFTPADLRAVLERVERERGLRNRVAALEDRVRSEVPEAELHSDDPEMQRASDMARRVAQTDAAVLLNGESGTGKGVVARALHGWSKRAAGPFVTVNCPSLHGELLEADLFGHVRGAFTGAVRDAPGKVAAAQGGTLFFDEVGELPIAVQPKLLRFLQEKMYERVGEPTTRSADVRVIAATNRDLRAAVASGTFREDLLYRLNVVQITLPPLRQRIDLLDLAHRLLGFFARREGRPITGFTAEARDALKSYAWPGNIRELRNALERAVILAEGPEIGLADLPENLASTRSHGAETTLDVGSPISLEQLEIEHIRRILISTPSRDEAARVLGIDPSTLYRKRKQYGL